MIAAILGSPKFGFTATRQDTRPSRQHLAGGGIKKLLTLLAICFWATVWQAAADPLQVGTTVDFDRVTSTNPNLGAWDRGVIIGTTTIGGQRYLKIRNKAGTPYTIPNDPRWIH